MEKPTINDFEIVEVHTTTTKSINSNVDIYLNTIDVIMNSASYNMGKFINRILRRFDLIDDFSLNGIACCQYNKDIRRIAIRINPLYLWSYMLRHLAVRCTDKNRVLGIDNELITASNAGGWTPEIFKNWVDFIISPDIVNNKKYSFSNCLMSVIIHEVMHPLWNHLSLDRKLEQHKVQNIAQDFAINQTLDFGLFNSRFMTTLNKPLLFCFFEGGAPIVDNQKIRQKYETIQKAFESKTEDFESIINEIDISDFDSTLFLHQPYEYYYSLLLNASDNITQVLGKSKLSSNTDGDMYDQFHHDMSDHDMSDHDMSDHDESNDSASENSKSEDGDSDEEDGTQNIACGRSDTGKSQFEGFNPITSEMKKVILNDLKRTVDEMLSTGEIKSVDDLKHCKPFGLNKAFINKIEKLYKTETKDWDRLLKNQVMKCMGMRTYDYTMKREARGAPNMFPGKSRLKSFDLIIVVDVSGSINLEDYNRFINEIEKIAKQVDHPNVRFIQFHSEVSVDIVIPLKRARTVGIPETGGTNLHAPLNMLEAERNKKLVIVFTDGWVENNLYNTYNFPSIIFVSSSGNNNICKSLTERNWKVIHQDGENDWWS